MATPNRGETVQKQIQQDWVNREYIEIITISIKKITDFLNSFDLSCRSKLAGLNEKLTTLERKIDYLEACSKRTMFYWINLQFNALDHDRKKILGPDRTCAEWILRNGGSVKWANTEETVSNYNKLPPEGKILKLLEVDATNTNIMHKGFEHFKGCEHIRKLILHRCNYLEDSALEDLRFLKNSLSYLQISSCHNITDKGLLQLKILNNLNDLILNNLPSVKDLSKTVQALNSSLPRCNIQV